MSPLVHLVLFFYCVNTSIQTRQWIEVQTGKTGSFTIANEMGLAVSRINSVVFTVKACSDAVIVISDQASIADNKGRYFLTMIGKDSNTMTQVMDSCFTCERTVIAKGKFLDCNKFMPFWVMWGGDWKFKMGKGSVVGREVFLTLQAKLDKYMGNFIQLTSTTTEPATFRFAKDEELAFYVPHPDGSTVIQVNETAAVGVVLLDVKVKPSTPDLELAVNGEGSEYFRMDNRTLRVNMSLDYETKTFYSLTIGTATGHSAAITIEVIDENDESPIVDIFPVSIPEEIAIDTLIGGFFSVSDRDKGDNLTFVLTGTNSNIFIASEEGMRITKRIDRDGADGIKEFNLNLTVTDLANHVTSAILNVTVTGTNDNSPVCDPDTLSRKISEGLTNDTDVVNLTSLCSDPDEETNSEGLTYRILGDEWVTSAFGIRDNGSLVALAGGLDLESAEQTSEFRLYLLVQDNGGKPKSRKTYITLNVEIIPLNEFPPVWQSSQANAKNEFEPLSVLITFPVGTKVAYLTALDGDKGDTLIYSLYTATKGDYADGSELFQLDTTNGALSVKRSLQGMKSVIVGVQVTDGNHTTQASVVITAVNSKKGGNSIPLPIPPPISSGGHPAASTGKHLVVPAGSGHSDQSMAGFDKLFYFIQTPTTQDDGKFLLNFSVNGLSKRHVVMVDMSASTFFSVRKTNTWHLAFTASPNNPRKLPTIIPLVIKDRVTKKITAESYVVVRARECPAATIPPHSNRRVMPKIESSKQNAAKAYKDTNDDPPQSSGVDAHAYHRYQRNHTGGCGVTISPTAKTLVIVSASEAVLLVAGIAYSVYVKLLSSKRSATVGPKGEPLGSDDVFVKQESFYKKQGKLAVTGKREKHQEKNQTIDNSTCDTVIEFAKVGEPTDIVNSLQNVITDPILENSKSCIENEWVNGNTESPSEASIKDEAGNIKKNQEIFSSNMKENARPENLKKNSELNDVVDEQKSLNDIDQFQNRNAESLKPVDTALEPMKMMDTALEPMKTMETDLEPMKTMDTALEPMKMMETDLEPMKTMETALEPMITVDPDLEAGPTVSAYEQPEDEPSLEVELSNESSALFGNTQALAQSDHCTNGRKDENKNIAENQGPGDENGLQEELLDKSSAVGGIPQALVQSEGYHANEEEGDGLDVDPSVPQEGLSVPEHSEVSEDDDEEEDDADNIDADMSNNDGADGTSTNGVVKKQRKVRKVKQEKKKKEKKAKLRKIDFTQTPYCFPPERSKD